MFLSFQLLMCVQAASAIESGDTETLRRLLDQGLHVNQTFRPFEETLLHMAVREKRDTMVKILITEYSADVDVKDGNGVTLMQEVIVL